MLEFKQNNGIIELRYRSSLARNNNWAWGKLKVEQKLLLSKVFHFKPSDLLNPPDESTDFDEYIYQFNFAEKQKDYIKINARIFNIKNDILIDENIPLNRKLFVAKRNISIFPKISKILVHSEPIIIGGENPTISRESFEELIQNFPNSHELNIYTENRIHSLLSQHLDGMRDVAQQYEKYLNKKKSFLPKDGLQLQDLKEAEIAKYEFIRESIARTLEEGDYWSEAEWQSFMLQFILLLFPKYIKILEKVQIYDYYSDSGNRRVREIDLMLIDANGYIDIIEIKRPFENKIFRNSLYRDNRIPHSELSGGIMQAEKYLFHLSKWGLKGEEHLTDKYKKSLPDNMKIRISNPKAIIIMGRDQINLNEMTEQERLDFEIIKRKYANMIDIITYDDLLRRLDNIIQALQSKSS
jgi:hypothetical protein